MRQGLSVVSWSSGTVEAGEDAIRIRLQEGLAGRRRSSEDIYKGSKQRQGGGLPFRQEVWRMGSFVQITKT